MRLKTLEGMDVSGKRVLLRVDFNVPMEGGRVTDDTRIRAHLETLRILRERGAIIGLVSHFGRPKGKVVPELSLEPVREAVKILTGWEIGFCEECAGEIASKRISEMRAGDICLFENIRFIPEEETNDVSFAEKLAAPYDLFVMDAFSAAHRAHASTEGVTRFLPSCAGKLMEKEISVLSEVREKPGKPMVMILGGAKVSDKIKFIQNMLDKTDVMLIGGAMAFPFLKAQGKQVGKSLCEEGTDHIASDILKTAISAGIKLILPVDLVVSDSPENKTNARTIKVDDMEDGFMGLDIGSETVDIFSLEIGKANTVLWNGPLGFFERAPFGEGTKRTGDAVCRRTVKGAVTVLGGGDTAAAANLLGFSDGVFHISTGGGATLEFFEGKELPGIAPLYEQ